MKKEKSKKLVIDRNKWLRGEKWGSLLDGDGKMCCLGFAARAEGFKPKEIRDCGMLSDTGISAKRLEKTSWLVTTEDGDGYLYRSDSAIATDLAAINDSVTTKDKDREKQIIKLFKKHGNIDVTFIN